jgi:hypothetical protein
MLDVGEMSTLTDMPLVYGVAVSVIGSKKKESAMVADK